MSELRKRLGGVVCLEKSLTASYQRIIAERTLPHLLPLLFREVVILAPVGIVRTVGARAVLLGIAFPPKALEGR